MKGGGGDLNVYHLRICQQDSKKSFCMDAEKIRNILKMETMTQSQLTLLAHSAIECTNKSAEKDPGHKRKAPNPQGGGG